MAKAPATTDPRPKAVDVLVSVAELALTYKYPDRVVTIAEMSRTVSIASRLLRFSNLDEKIETENLVVLALAKKRELIH